MTVEPPLVLDRDGPVPMAVQLTGQLRAAVAGNRLRAGERLPSSRSLAASLGVSRTVVTNAYLQLFAEGWLEGRHGSGTYVAQGAAGGRETEAQPSPPGAPVAAVQASSALGQPQPAVRHQGTGPAPEGGRPSVTEGEGSPVTEMRPGIPWVAGIDRAAWRRAWRRAGDAAPSGWPDPRGLLSLRQALCRYLRRTRGLGCTPDQVLITRGVAGGLSLLAAALLRPGERAGLEEPGYPVGRAIRAGRGAQVVPCPVDSQGLITDRLPGGLRLVYSTPAHQYPLGGRLPVPRRQALVAWARAAGALVVEDDYDSEFRYDVAPLPALYGLDPDAVAYLGTTAKTLTPALGVGWLVARPDLISTLADPRESVGDRAGEAAQRALLAMIETGDLDRHVRRMRREYARRRDAIVSALGDAAVPGTLRGDTAGLHVVLELHRDGEDEVAAAALARGVRVHTLRRYFAGPVTTQGLVLGYGGLSLAQVAAAAAVLRDVLAR
ncbi:MAG: PLP-dependent aminotransferase family protein [Kitasatospora sp.]|nr:PLP-dependent aminotransferase family protein [Kitasatospora sp.]